MTRRARSVRIPRMRALVAAGAGVLAALVTALAVSCTGGRASSTGPLASGATVSFVAQDIRYTVLLIGDAGAARRTDAVLVALRRMASEAPEHTLVVFLGDNLYEAGLPAGDGPEVERLRDVLRAQLWATGAAQALFVAGNHDWNEYRRPSRAWSAGQAAVARQAQFLVREGQGRVRFLPAPGCAGPAVLVVNDGGAPLRVIAIDTQWWLTALELPPPAAPRERREPGCTARTTEQAARELAHVVAESPAPLAIVVGHHPLASNGRHGHPLLGWPFNPQDIPNGRNARFRTALVHALDSARVVLYAAGHDHDLELFRGPGAQFTLVSGAGSPSKVGPFKGERGAPLARDVGPGFARLDLLDGGRLVLRLLSVTGEGTSERACVWLAPASLAAQRCR